MRLRLLVVGVFTSLTFLTHALTTKPIKRVAIIGSGVGGLTLAHALDGMEKISIFDSRTELDPKEGAGFQLNGGLAALDPSLQQAVREAGLPLRGIQSRSKAWFGKEKNDFSTLLQLDIQKIIQDARGEVAETLLDENNNARWSCITRGSLQKVLNEKLPTSTQVQLNKRLVNIKKSDDGVVCEFEDGTVSGPFDMIAGCDGIRSTVKEYVDSNEISSPGSSSLESSDAIYSGIRIRFAVSDGKPGEGRPENVKLTQYFGDGGYALHGYFGTGKEAPPTQMAVLVFLDENYAGPFKLREKRKDEVVVNENADWTQNVEQVLEASRTDMLEQLQSYSIPDKEAALQSVIQRADRIYELGSYFHNPFTSWSKVLDDGSCVVLCGDAAHAMPPFLGQGSNQAIQSAYCLADKIKKYNRLVDAADSSVSLKKILSEYRDIRWPPTFDILWKALFLGYLETGGSNGLYSKFRDTFFKTLGAVGVAKRVLMSAATPKL